MSRRHTAAQFGVGISTVIAWGRITDRGPFVRGRIIDLSSAAARALGISGLAPVTLTVGVGGWTAQQEK
jgi:rare lipoprotein A